MLTYVGGRFLMNHRVQYIYIIMTKCAKITEALQNISDFPKLITNTMKQYVESALEEDAQMIN